METRYISYSRVSTNEQGEKGVSIEAQKEEHQRWARENGIEIYRYFTDSGYSAGSFKRPGLQEMISLIAENKKTKKGYPYRYVLLIRYQSRLIRDISKKRSLQCVFEKYNVSVQCLNGDWKREPNAGGIVTDIQMLIDENERLQVSGRVYDSYRHIAMAGCYPIGGKRPPLGYKKVRAGKNWKLAPDEIEAPQIKSLFEMLATGEFTAKKACVYLNSQEFLGRRWSWHVLTKLIDNPLYYGRFQTAWFDSEDPTIDNSLKAGWFNPACHTEPIISKDLYDQVQMVMHRRKSQRNSHVYYFKDKIICNLCGSHLKNRCAWRSRTNESILYKYYFCSKCQKRINESFILDEFLYRYPNWERKIKDISFCEKTKASVKKKEEEQSLLTELFEEDLLSKEDYTKRYKVLAQSIVQQQNELQRISAKKKLDWSDLTEQEKMDIIQNSVDSIIVIPGPIDSEAAIVSIKFYDEPPMIKESKKKR